MCVCVYLKGGDILHLRRKSCQVSAGGGGGRGEGGVDTRHPQDTHKGVSCVHTPFPPVLYALAAQYSLKILPPSPTAQWLPSPAPIPARLPARPPALLICSGSNGYTSAFGVFIFKILGSSPIRGQ